MNETTQRFRVSACCNGVLAQIQQRRRVDTARCSFRCAVAALLCFMSGAFFFGSVAAVAQKRTFARDGVAFTLELPSPGWRAVSRLDVHDHVEFINGKDPLDGYLRMRENCVDAGTTAADLARREKHDRLQHLSAYVDCGEVSFAGNFNGVSISYEYTSGGTPMAGRIYFLQVDNRTIYVLHQRKRDSVGDGWTAHGVA